MPQGLPVLIILTALALSYASVLLFIRLTSLGVSNRRTRGIIGEVWVIFAVIIFTFWLASLMLPHVPANSIAGELAAELRSIHILPLYQQGIILALFVMAVVLLLHLLRSLRIALRDISPLPSDKEVEP